MRFRNPSVLVDDVGDALRVFVARRIRGAVRDADAAIGVAKQREREVELLRKSGVVRDVVEARAENRRVLFLVFADEVPEPGTLFRSARCVGLRIEPEHHFASAQIMQRDGVAVVIRNFEIGSFVANLQHSPSSQRLQCEPQRTGKRHSAIVVPLQSCPTTPTPDNREPGGFFSALCVSVVNGFQNFDPGYRERIPM